jgi:methylated-DNA-[protein]-cysteine S-methyltransferase
MNTTMNTKLDLRYRIVDSPIGSLTLAGDDALHLLWMDAARHAPDRHPEWVPDPECFAGVVQQLDAYFAGELTEFDVTLRLDGTEFQQRVWNALRDIPYGETVSYGELAARVGNPGASRAVGLANGRNPVAIIVPCHRVIGASGSLTGYGGGLDRKRALLELERAHARPGLLDLR